MSEAPSPFLPGTKLQWAWDSTSLGWLKECPRKYQYGMIEGWRSKGESVHLRFGIEYHHAIELYDRLRVGEEGVCLSDGPMDHEGALRIVVQDALNQTWEPEIPPDEDGRGRPAQPWSPDHPSKTRETLIRSIIWYLDQFRDDPAKTVTLANGKPAVELSFKMPTDIKVKFRSGRVVGKEVWDTGSQEFVTELQEEYVKGGNYMLCGHLDRLVTFASDTFVMDRKTTGTTLSPHYFSQFQPDNQMSLYAIAAEVIYQTPVRGIIIDAAQIAVGFTRFDRGMTYRTPGQNSEWLTDLEHWFRQAEYFAEHEYWPQNDKSCFLCPFREVCSKDPGVREIYLKSNFEVRPWNPLEPR